MKQNTIEHIKPSENDTSSMKNELKNYLKELSAAKKQPLNNNSSSIEKGPMNTNDLGGLLTGENVIGLGGMSSSSYSTF